MFSLLSENHLHLKREWVSEMPSSSGSDTTHELNGYASGGVGLMILAWREVQVPVLLVGQARGCRLAGLARWGMLLSRSANPSGSLRVGHAAAKPSYVTLPRRSASEEKVSSCLNFPISSFQYGNDHFSGDSTTPSNDMKRVAANRDISSSHSRENREPE